MRSLAIVASIAAALAACSGGGDDDASTVDARPAADHFDIDAVVWSWGVDLWFREPAPICDPPQYFPRPGECQTFTDGFGCSNDDSCILRISVERDGVTLAESVGPPPSSPLQIHVALDDTPAELVIAGCTGTYRIPLPPLETARPALTDVTWDGVELRGTASTPRGTTGTIAGMYYGLAAEECHVAADDEWRVRPPSPSGDLGISAIHAYPPVTTAAGTVYPWSLTQALDIPEIAFPTRLAGDRWALPLTTQPTSTVEVDGAPFSGWPGFGWEVVMTPAGPRHTLTRGSSFRYEAGETTDQLRAQFSDGLFVATFTHVTPSNELTFSTADDGQFALAVGPVTMTSESAPSLTRTVAFTVDWRHPLIARPVP